MEEVSDFRITTDEDCIGQIPHPFGVSGFIVLGYKGGTHTVFPINIIANWRNYCDTPGALHIGRCTGLGAGSSIRFSLPSQSVRIGRYVSAGIETIFMCSGFHETRSISTCEFGSYDKDCCNPQQREHGEIEVGHDVWFGDECLIMAGAKVANGCVIGARSLLPVGFKSEPYGIYAGSPAQLKKFRFSAPVREALLNLAWWDMPFAWVRENNKSFLHDMTSDGAMEAIAELTEKKAAYAR